MPSSKSIARCSPSSYASPSIVKERSMPVSRSTTLPCAPSSSAGSRSSSTIASIMGAASASSQQKYVSRCTAHSAFSRVCIISPSMELATQRWQTTRGCSAIASRNLASFSSCAYEPWPRLSQCCRCIAAPLSCASRSLRKQSISLSPSCGTSSLALVTGPDLTLTLPSAPAASHSSWSPPSACASPSNRVSSREVASPR
mmetsp:Transcript_23929/g.63136  ORF Transcript_23929/g.63136 Transcript_23929/m.63136 type:complete len:200 (+) Transcript_23929:408-1007(+)